VHPGVGFVLADNLVAGLNGGLFIQALLKGVNKERVIGAGPMFRYYIGGSSVKVFPHAQVTYNSYTTLKAPVLLPLYSTKIITLAAMVL
jgi:hypothetical protein